MAEVVDAKSTNRGSAWSVETNPKYVRAWLASLSPLSSPDSARELFQGLHALSRVELDPGQRYEILQLYQTPVREACETFRSMFHRASVPAAGKLRRRAGFVCQLHMEMARGYIRCLTSLSKVWVIPWRRRQMLVLPAERALHHLSEVLMVSYQLYLPYPADVWRSAHTAYGMVELHGRHSERIDAEEGNETINVSVSQRYRRLLLLGAANPYQMPFGECIIVNRLLGRWVDNVSVGTSPPQADRVAAFFVDLSMDVPPVASARMSPHVDGPNVRWLDVTEFTRTLHGMLRRLEKGEAASSLQLGVECLDSACYDMLQRLHRMYGQAASRRHSRIKRHETVVICAGIGALHFFAGGQKLFASHGPTAAGDASIAAQAEGGVVSTQLSERGATDSTLRSAPDSFRVDRWYVKDVCPQGLMIAQEKESESSVRFRVGDVLGIQRVNIPGHWGVGLVRWFKAVGEGGIEVGVELISPDVAPASIKLTADDTPKPTLVLPAVEATQTLASIVTARGTVQLGSDCFITSADGVTRRVRVLDVLEHTNAIEQIVVGDLI